MSVTSLSRKNLCQSSKLTGEFNYFFSEATCILVSPFLVSVIVLGELGGSATVAEKPRDAPYQLRILKINFIGLLITPPLNVKSANEVGCSVKNQCRQLATVTVG